MAKKASTAIGATQRAVQGLTAQILSGTLSPGEKIRQEEMAERLAISRVPLRDAMNILADQGLLVHRPNQGYFVIKRTADEFAQIRRIVEILETELCRSLIWPDRNVLDTIKALNKSMALAVKRSDVDTLFKLNREFHFTIFGQSPHHLIIRELNRLWSMSESVIRAKFIYSADRERAIQEHDLIIEALRRQDRAALIRELDRHRGPEYEPLGGPSSATSLQQSFPKRGNHAVVASVKKRRAQTQRNRRKVGHAK